MVVPSKRVKNVHYVIRDIVERTRDMEKAGKKILYLNIGDPIKYDFATPPEMVEAVSEAMRQGYNGYADALGDVDARKAVAKKAGASGVKLGVKDVLLTTGASEGIGMALSALLNKGDNILTPSPGYPQYVALINLLEADLNEYVLDEKNRWQPDLKDIESRINDRTQAILVINPNNPTGALYDKAILEGIVEIARKHDLIILSDEIYSGITYDRKHVSMLEVSKDVPVLVFNGLSKTFLVPGWRLGWIVFHDPKKAINDYREGVLKLARVRLCSPHPFQRAVKVAMEGCGEYVKDMNKKLVVRRDYVYRRLNEIKGLSCVKPEGAFYAFPRIDLKIKSDKDFVLGLLKEKNVLFVYGSGFMGESKTLHFRTVFLPPVEVLEEAFGRLEEYIHEHYKV